MSLIDKTYFVGEINIPDTSNPAVEERLNHFIAKYEAEFLQTVLGYSLSKSYAAGIAEDPADQIWIDLRDGKEYLIGTDTYKYFGLHNETLKLSPIANYVYYWWTRSDTKAKPDEAERQAAYFEQRNQSMIRAWNEMAMWVNELTWFLNENALIYPDWQTVNWYTVYRGRNYSLASLMRPINNMNL